MKGFQSADRTEEERERGCVRQGREWAMDLRAQ